MASSMLAPEAMTAQTIAPAEEPANGVVSCLKEKRTTITNSKVKTRGKNSLISA